MNPLLLWDVRRRVAKRKRMAARPSLASMILQSQCDPSATLCFGNPLEDVRHIVECLANGIGTGHRLYTYRSAWVSASRYHLGWWDTDVPRMDSATFKRHFRMTPSTFDLLVEDCASLERFGWRGIPLRKRIAMGVHRLANGCSFFMQGEQIFKTGASTARNMHKELIEHLSTPRIVTKYIKLPADQRELTGIANEFQQARKIPGVIGALDGSHFPHMTQDVESTEQLNRHGWPSILAMAMCTRQLVLTSFKAGWLGCTSDTAALDDSKLWDYLMNDLEEYPELRVSTDGNGSLDIPFYALGDGIFKMGRTVIIPYVPHWRAALPACARCH